MLINGVRIEADFDADAEELANYVAYTKARIPEVSSIKVVSCPDGGVDVKWTAHYQKFERIRRITGYLSGDITTWNNAKQAEERERVKHL